MAYRDTVRILRLFIDKKSNFIFLLTKNQTLLSKAVPQTCSKSSDLIMATFKLFEENSTSICWGSNKRKNYVNHILHQSDDNSYFLPLGQKTLEQFNVIDPTWKTQKISC